MMNVHISPRMERLTGFSTTPLLPVAVCLMAGIAVGNWWLPDFPVLFVLLVAVALAFACWRWPLMQSVAILTCCVTLGMTLIQMQGEDDEILEGRELHGVVMSEPAERPKTVGMDVLVPSAGGRMVRCYLWKDERSRALRPGDGIVICRRGQTQGAALTFVRSSEWYSGGNGQQQLNRWQRTRLWFLKQRNRLLQHYRDFGAEEETYAVLAAVTLGDKSAQTVEMREAFVASGASHVLAISGLHIGIVYMLLTGFKLGRTRFWLTQVLTLSAIWAFALLTGLSPSVTRAATMITLYGVFACRDGRAASVNVLCFTAIVMLLANARMFFDVSFQLSFAAVFAIVVFMPMLRVIYQPQNVLLRWTWNVILLSTCAQLGVAPLIAYHFGRFPVYFLLTNLLVVPAALLILYGSLLSLLLPPASAALLGVVRVLNGSLRCIAALPGASIEGLHPSVLQVALMYVFIGILAAIVLFFTKYTKMFTVIGKK